MAIILASTRSTFFNSYEGFQFNPLAPLYAEFRRLAKSRGWKQGSNSKVFDRAWTSCFGHDVPVGQNIDRVEIAHTGDDSDDGDEASLLARLQGLNLNDTKAVKISSARVEGEFTSHYGTDASKLEKWQNVCLDCGISPAPTSITQCKKALKGLSINIYHFLEAKRDGRIPYRFPSKRALVRYLEQHPAKRYPLHMAKANEFLKALLVGCW